MKRRVFLWIVLASALMLLMFSVHGMAQGEAIRLDAQVGYDGVVIGGGWYPLFLEIENSGEAFSGEVSVQLGRRQTQYDELVLPVMLAAGEAKQIRIPVTTEITQERFDVCLRVEDEIIAEKSVKVQKNVQDSSMIIGVLGGEETLARALCVTYNNDELGREESIQAIPLTQALFPQTLEEMSAFHLLMMDGFDLSGLSQEQQALLEAWIKSGGIVIRSQTTAQEAQADADAPTEDVVALLLAYADAADSAAQAQSVPVYPMTADAAQEVLIENEMGALLVKQDVGEGFVLTCGFGLNTPEMIRAAQRQLWRRVLLKVDQDAYNNSFRSERNGNTEYALSLSSVRVSRGDSILPIAVMLLGYTLLAGVALFVIFRRMDRSRALWAAIPVTAILACGLVAFFAEGLGLNQPAAVSMHASIYDIDGSAQAYEQVHIGYAEQDRAVISAQTGEVVERMRYSYYSRWSEMNEQATLRDRLTLGASPSVELPAKAPWVVRDLIVHTDRIPQGTIDVTAFMAEDGLHATIVNNTPQTLKNAVLLTQIGYAQVGTLTGGQTQDVLIARPQSYAYHIGKALILPNQMTPYAVGLYQAASASVYPEEQAEIGFERSSLGEEEVYARSQRYSAISSAVGMTGGEANFEGVLFAECEEVACAPLSFNGQPITRHETRSIVVKKFAIPMVSSDGYFYYPSGTFPVLQATAGEDGAMTLTETAASYEITGEDVYYGLRLEGVDRAQIREIRIHPQGNRIDEIIPQVYDHEKGEWIRAQGIVYGLIPDSMAERVVSENGELFMRFSAEALGDEYAYVPEIIVEGGDQK